MVLTDRQRSDLHAGIYEYLCSRKELVSVAETMKTIYPDLAERYTTTVTSGSTSTGNSSSSRTSSSTRSRTSSSSNSNSTTNHSQPQQQMTPPIAPPTTTATTTTTVTPLLEKKWTAIPRLQKKVLELEKYIAQSAKIHAHRSGGGMNYNSNGTTTTTSSTSTSTSTGAGPMMIGAGGGTNDMTTTTTTAMTMTSCRMLPRLPPTHVLNGHSMVITCCTVHPIYTIALSGSEDGTIKIWDHESGDYIRTLKGHTNTVNSIQCSPKQGCYILSCSTDLSIKLWDISTYQCLRTLRGHDHTISAICFIPHISDDNNTNTNTYTTNTHTNTTDTAAYNNNNTNHHHHNNTLNSKKTGTGVDSTMAMSQFILSASRDRTVKCWDIESGFCDYTVSDHTDWVRCLAVRQSDGTVWASAGNDQIIYVYETCTKRKIVELRGHEHVIESIAFVTEETVSSKTTTTTTAATTTTRKLNTHTETVREYLVSGSRDRCVKLWNISDSSSVGSCIGTYQAHDNWVRSVVLHPSGLYIISSSDDKTIRIYDIKNNRCLRTLDHAHDHFITCLAIHPTLPILISGSVDQTLRCWLLQ